MNLVLFTTGRKSPCGVFYPHDESPAITMERYDAADLLRMLRMIDPRLVTDPGRGLIGPARFADLLRGPTPVTFQYEVDVLGELCSFAEARRLLVAWGY